MADKTAIEWTDATWTPVVAYRLDGKRGWYCERVSEGCRNCYAQGINLRLGTGLDFKPGHRDKVTIRLHEETLTQPLVWKRPRMIFVCSMSDLFGPWVTDAMLDSIFATMQLARQHTFQVLTKRPERAREYFKLPRPWTLAALPNVWLGTSCEDQETADERIPHLLATPAAVHFISAEPLLGPITLHPLSCGTNAVSSSTGPNIGWVIVGGESGPHARPMQPEWARSLRDQCAAAGVKYFFKQWGEWIYDERVGRKEMRGRDQPHAIDELRSMLRVGKRNAGRLLDGQEHSGFPHHG